MCQCLHIIEICIYTTACVSNTIVFLFLFWFLTKNKLNFTTCSLFSFRGQKKRRLISPHPPHVYYEGAFLAKTSKGKKENKSTKISLKDRNSDGARENALRRSRVTRVTERDARFGHILFCGAKGLNHVLIHFCSLCRELGRRTDTQSS